MRDFCHVCRRMRNYLRKNRKTGEMTCTECGKSKGVCTICGDIKPVHKRTEAGPLCSSCYGKVRRADKETHEVCSICSDKKPVGKRGLEDEPICYLCCAKDKTLYEPCSICGDKRQVCKRIEGKPFCNNCARKLNVEICSLCGRGPKIVAKRAEDGGAICYACYELPRYHERKEKKQAIEALSKTG